MIRRVINVPELERISAEQRQSVLEEAVRRVNASHGTMGRVPHYVGCALVVAVVLPLAITKQSALAAVLLGIAAYAVCLLIGMWTWRRSMARELRTEVARMIVTHDAAVARFLAIREGTERTPHERKIERRRTTVAEAEAEHTPKGEDPERVKRFPELAKPFGPLNEEWEKLKTQMQPGDELWVCCTDQESWVRMQGGSWLELTRAGKPIACIVLAMN